MASAQGRSQRAATKRMDGPRDAAHVIRLGTAEEFRRKAAGLDEFKPIVFDEGTEGLYVSEHMKKENKKT